MNRIYGEECKLKFWKFLPPPAPTKPYDFYSNQIKVPFPLLSLFLGSSIRSTMFSFSFLEFSETGASVRIFPMELSLFKDFCYCHISSPFIPQPGFELGRRYLHHHFCATLLSKHCGQPELSWTPATILTYSVQPALHHTALLQCCP
jgi:hypothetical protein